MELFEHNRKAYEAVKREFSDGVLRTCVVHPTGTGKSYIALQLIEDNPEKSILYVTSLFINLNTFKEEVEKMNIPQSHVEFSLYSSLDKCYGHYDYIILDEFHRAGAQDWSKGLSLVLNDNPDAYILGLSATPIRYLDSFRNMAEELFDGRIASQITLKDALISKLLPMPRYKSAVYSFEEEFSKAERLLKKRYDKKAERLLDMAKQNLELADGLDKFFEENMEKPNGKYIVFCRNIEHLESMMEEAESWFSWVDERHLYKVYSSMQSLKEYEDFLEDDSNALRLLFCVDMLNEGTHVDGIDGCIMLRPTSSLNVYYQQLGRALNVSNSKNPEVFDIVHNSYNLEPVRHFWGSVREEYQMLNPDAAEQFFTVYGRDIQILQLLEEFEEALGDSWHYYYQLCEKYYKEHGDLNVPCNYQTEGHVLYVWINRQQHAKQRGELSQEKIDLLDLLNINWEFKVDRSNWDGKFEALLEYKEKYGDLNVVSGYVTEDGFALGKWCKGIRNQYKSGQMSQKKIVRLNEIGFDWSPISAEVPQRWMNAYKLLQRYIEANGPAVPAGCEFEGFKLGQWATHVRYQYKYKDDPEFKKKKLSNVQIRMLEEIGFAFDNDEELWERNYREAKEYFEANGTLTGAPNHAWITRQRNIMNNKIEGTLTPERIRKLELLNIDWNPTGTREKKWEANFRALKEYKAQYGVFPTEGKLHDWYLKQKYSKSSLTEEKISKLDSIGMIWAEKQNDTEFSTDRWEKTYARLCAYIDENGAMPPVKHELYYWCSAQRSKRKRTEQSRAALESGELPLKLEKMLSDYQIEKLDQIGFDWKGADAKVSSK